MSKKEPNFIKRLKNLHARFLNLTPEKQAEFSHILSAISQTITDAELLDLFTEIEAIFTLEVKKNG